MFSFLILCFFGPFCLFFFLLIHNFSFKFCIPNQFHRTANTTLPGQEYLIQKYNVCHLPVFGRSSSQFLHTHTQLCYVRSKLCSAPLLQRCKTLRASLLFHVGPRTPNPTVYPLSVSLLYLKSISICVASLGFDLQSCD